MRLRQSAESELAEYLPKACFCVSC